MGKIPSKPGNLQFWNDFFAHLTFSSVIILSTFGYSWLSAGRLRFRLFEHPGKCLGIRIWFISWLDSAYEPSSFRRYDGVVWEQASYPLFLNRCNINVILSGSLITRLPLSRLEISAFCWISSIKISPFDSGYLDLSSLLTITVRSTILNLDPRLVPHWFWRLPELSDRIDWLLHLIKQVIFLISLWLTGKFKFIIWSPGSSGVCPPVQRISKLPPRIFQ